MIRKLDTCKLRVAIFFCYIGYAQTFSQREKGVPVSYNKSVFFS